MRNTYMRKQVGVTRWARQDSNLTSENTSNDIENAEIEQSSLHQNRDSFHDNLR